jgi:DNA modification methylase
VLTWPSDPNLNHPAQKPVALYTDLLRRSCNPGDRVLDPFAGTGTIFPAAHSLKIFATGVEKNQSAYGIAVRRLKELK